MRIASVSDLHVDYLGNHPVIDAMVDRVRSEKIDVLVLAGDLSSDVTKTLKLIARMANVASHVVFVPGNHDLWTPLEGAANFNANKTDTWFLYREVYPEACHQLKIHYLPNEPLLLGKNAVVGTCGWYDYSFASSENNQIKSDHFSRGNFSGLQWADATRTCFRDKNGDRMKEPDIVQTMVDDLLAQLKSVPKDVDNIIGISHFLPFKELLEEKTSPIWAYITAFLGSNLIGEAFKTDTRVKNIIYGHTHTPREMKLGDINLISTPLGYPKEWFGTPEAVAISRMAIIDI